MKGAVIATWVTTLVIPLVVSLIIDKPACSGKFYCPDHCNVTWRRNCPHNCFCGPIKYCPSVSCPASYPTCLVFTTYDGCNSCACKIPFAFLKANASSSEAQVAYDDPNHLRTMDEGHNLTNSDGDEVIIVKKMMCTIQNMSHVDHCLKRTLEFHQFARDRKRDDQPITINPMVQLGDQDMKALCRLFTDAIDCIGEQTYDDCRRDHPDLSEMDSLLKYACGPKSPHFFQHFPCISDVHRRNTRVQLCEDVFVNALLVIQETQGPAEYKRAQKCKALNWFLKCSRPNVHRYCSPAAADVYAESMMSATEYMAPECHADFVSGQIRPKAEEKIDITLMKPKEPLSCSLSHQFAVFALFKPLYNEVRSVSSSASPGFPVAYAYGKEALLERCEHFMKVLYQVPVEIRKRCYRNFEVFDQVYGAFAYACSPDTGRTFLHHFDCLKELRINVDIIECELEARRHLVDPSVDQCEVYDLLAKCVHETVERKCGSEAWDTHFQLLAISVKRYVPDCTLSPIYRVSYNSTVAVT